MIKRWDVLNHLIGKYGYKSYLEIGVMEPSDLPEVDADYLQENKCFDRVVCDFKVGVDPLPLGNPTFLGTSDEFFAQNKRKFDLIFIDGLHEEFQAKKDILNALNCLAPNGSIVVHDCLSPSETAQRVPRESDEWVGDVWKALVRVRVYPYQVFVVDVDYGCGVIRQKYQAPWGTDLPLTYENLVLNMNEWLNLISWDEFLQIIE